MGYASTERSPKDHPPYIAIAPPKPHNRTQDAMGVALEGKVKVPGNHSDSEARSLTGTGRGTSALPVKEKADSLKSLYGG